MVKRKAYHFGHVTQGMNVVNAIAKDDVIKRSLLRESTLAKKFDAPKYSLIIF
jgi:cyclophilin family peptidyl-prolyl cis-trans isomerase